jgi:hypothetical protein
MAQTDKSAFLGVLRQAEDGMDEVFGSLARDLGAMVMGMAAADGKVPVERLPEVQRRARQMVDAAFLGMGGKPYDEQHKPLAPFPRVISEAQLAMIDLALNRTAKILDDKMPEDVRRALAMRGVRGDHTGSPVQR